MKPIKYGTRRSQGTLTGKELHRTEDDYGSIIVTQRGNKRLLSFGSRLEQSSVLVDKPYYLIHEYSQIMLLGLLFTEARRITLLGLGGGGLTHCLSHFYPESTIQVVEIRQAVIDIAYDWFDLPERNKLQVINDDAAHFLSRLAPHSSDIIFSDLYLADGMAACQAQQDFIVASYHALSESGCLVLNFHSKPHSGSLLMDTIESFFDNIVVHDSVVSLDRKSTIMFCCKRVVALHQQDMNWRAEMLAKQVKMPLLQHYRHLVSEAKQVADQTHGQ